MIIGSVFDNSLNKNIKYSYHKRGLNTIYNPDSVKEENEQDYYTSENGNLFSKKEVAWYDTVVLNDGIDIKVELDEATETVKTVFGTQLGQAELSQIMVYNMEVNTDNVMFFGESE